MPRKKKVSGHPPIQVRLLSKQFTENQKKLFDLACASDTKIIFMGGPAGSTKTYMAVYFALSRLIKNEDLDLLYVRTVVESGDRDLGYLPGGIDEKFNPYMLPLEDKLDEILPLTHSPTFKKDFFEKGRIQAMPINYLRGASWNNKIVIADEAQNFSFKELTTLVTRIGDNTKLLVCGDFMQSDIRRSGFGQMYNIFSDGESASRGIHSFSFTEDDIMRSEILKFIIRKLENETRPGRNKRNN
jgi:phosphate starvation-inducible PhoH-like protein